MAVPSVNVDDVIVDPELMAPLVKDPAVDSDPAFSEAVPSVRARPVILLELDIAPEVTLVVDSDPLFITDVPSVTVADMTDPELDMLPAAVIDPARDREPE